MRAPIRVLVLGTGQMGSGICRLVLEKPGLELVGVFSKRAERAGMELGQVLGLPHTLDKYISVDLRRVLEQTYPDIAIQATCSSLVSAVTEIATLIDHNVNVISIAEEMANPKQCVPAIAEQIHWQAVSQGVAVLGTGINPGFIFDLLVVTLTAVCTQVNSISAQRINDLSPYGPSVLHSQGVGLSPQAFQDGINNGTVVGHIGFTESMNMIAKAVGWNIERIEQTRVPIITQVVRETPFIKVLPGQVAGCDHSATAFIKNNAVISLKHPQQIQPFLEGVQTGDSIKIQGIPDVALAGSPEIPGGSGTIALAVNTIPRVLNAAPGLYSMVDLPVPAAMLADARNFIA